MIPIRPSSSTVRENNPEIPPLPQIPRFGYIHLENLVLTTGKKLHGLGSVAWIGKNPSANIGALCGRCTY